MIYATTGLTGAGGLCGNDGKRGTVVHAFPH